MNYFEKHVGDHLKDTAHLSMIEDGAYNRLLDLYYSRERPLPADVRECCKLARAKTKLERETVKLILKQFFTFEVDGFRHRRCDQEIERYKSKRTKAKASADARWGNQDSASERNANAFDEFMRSHSVRNAFAMRSVCNPRAAPVTSHQTHMGALPPIPLSRGLSRPLESPDLPAAGRSSSAFADDRAQWSKSGKKIREPESLVWQGVKGTAGKAAAERAGMLPEWKAEREAIRLSRFKSNGGHR